MKINKITVSISKMTYYIGFICIYGIFFQAESAVFNPLINKIIGVNLGLLILLILSNNSKLTTFVFKKELILWLLFIFWGGTTGLIVADYRVDFIDRLFYLIQQTVIIIFIVTIVKIDRNIKKTSIMLILLALAEVMYICLNGYSQLLLPRLDKAIYDLGNANGIGGLFLMGISAIAIVREYDNNPLKRIVYICLIVFFTIEIINTGSRKMFLAVMILFACLYYFNILANKNRVEFKTIVRLLVLFVIVATIISFVIPYIMSNTLLGLRWSTIGKDESTLMRETMYREGLEFLVSSPIFGIGFDQFRLNSVSNMYSHSNYIELLSNTGIVGFIIYYSIYLSLIRKLFLIRRVSTKGSAVWKTSGCCISIIFYQLFLGFGAVQYFSLNTWIPISIIIGFCNVNLDKIKLENNLERNIK